MLFTIRKLLLVSLIIMMMAGSTGTGAMTSVHKNNVKTDAIKLSISTRHDAILYDKVAAAFVKTSLAASVGITSTSEIQFTAPSTYEGFYKEMTDPFFKKDLGWGGGPTLFTALANQGAVKPMTDPDVLAVANQIENVTAGAAMKHYINDSLVWVGSAISSFGFTVNNKVLQDRGLAKPTTWDDLGKPDYYTYGSEYNIGMGNAPDTTSNTRIYQIILQKYGWEKGWELLTRMAGNSKIYGGSVETLNSVIAGETAIAMTIDFYGLNAMASNPNCEYIVPTNGSIVNADPIAYAQNPAHPAAAKAFIQYVLSPEGQAVLFDPQINRLPVRADAFDVVDSGSGQTMKQIYPDLYDLYQRTISNKGIDFDEDLATAQYSTMRWYFEYSITDVHTKLRNTWSQMVSAYKNGGFPTSPEQRFEQLAEAFGVTAISSQDAINLEPQINDAAFKLQKQGEWNDFASKKFDNVAGMIDDPYTITSVVTSGNTTLTSVLSTQGSGGGDTTKNVPLPTFWLMIGIFTPVLILRLKTNRRKKQLS